MVIWRRGFGLVGLPFAEEYGGSDASVFDTCLAGEALGYGSSDMGFCLSWGAHVAIGGVPIWQLGTEEQKKKYLPKLASGELVSSYSLSEASSASDAMNAKARAVLSEDGKSWILNGEKMWLSNAGFADIYITFAKVDGEHFTAFIVEKGMPGVSLGAEEKKTGIKGSSTCALILTDAVIPKENLLGEIHSEVGGLRGSPETVADRLDRLEERQEFTETLIEQKETGVLSPSPER